MKPLPSPEESRAFREYLDANDYSESSLRARLGDSRPPAPADLARAVYVTREPTAANALARLFLLGTSMPEPDVRAVLSADMLAWCLASDLLRSSSGRIRGGIVIAPVEGLLFASDSFDLLGSADASGFVPPASIHAANYLRLLTMRGKTGRTLDLGCGCGIQALFAADHSDTVVATDINDRAVGYARFNAMLNGIDNVECRAGDFFAPVDGERFDLIVSNPPFVPGPGQTFVYRDNEYELDSLCRNLLREAPQYLQDGGYIQLLCETVEIEGEPWEERIRDWVRDTGCDAWVLHNPPVPAAAYAGRRAADIAVTGDATDNAAAWLDYFDASRVSAIHPCLFVLRRREGDNWLHVHNLPGDVSRPAGDAVRRGIAANDFLQRCSSNEALLDAVLAPAPQLTLEQQFGRDGASWQARRSVLRMTDGLDMDAEVDMPVLAFLNLLDGRRSLGESVAAFADTVGADDARIAADLLPVVRLFVARGFLVPAAG